MISVIRTGASTKSSQLFKEAPVQWNKITGGGLVEEHSEQKVLWIPTEEIQPNPNQPRRNFEERALRELSHSIQQYGILQPLTVRKTENGWELIAGERRLRAARLAGLETVPCLETKVDYQESALLALVENIQRRDLHYFEEAAAISILLKETGMTQEAVAERLGRSPSAVANKLRLLRLDSDCRTVLIQEGLTERHARCLLQLDDAEERLAAARHFAKAHLSVAQAEQYIDHRLAALQTNPPQGKRSFIIKDVRLFLNSVDRGLRIIRDAGIDAASERQDTDDSIILTLRIPKRRSSS